MCSRCAELEERIAWLEGELGMRYDWEVRHKIHRHLLKGSNTSGTRAPAAMIAMLWAAKGRPISKDMFLEALPPVSGGEDDRNSQIVTQWAGRARQGLGGKHMIETVFGYGYRLTAAGAERVSELLAIVELPPEIYETREAVRKHFAWSDNEVETLRQLRIERRLSWGQCALKMKRSRNSVKGKGIDLGL